MSVLLDAGLFVLHQLCIIVGACVACKDPGLQSRVRQLLSMNGYDATYVIKVLEGTY